MKIITLCVVTASLTACLGRPYAHADWPTGVAEARAEARALGKACVIMFGPGDSYDHIIGDWQPAFLHPTQMTGLRSLAVVTMCDRGPEREAVAREFGLRTDNRAYGGPIFIVLDKDGKLLSQFSASSTITCERRAIFRNGEGFAALLHGRLLGVLTPGNELADLNR